MNWKISTAVEENKTKGTKIYYLILEDENGNKEFISTGEGRVKRINELNSQPVKAKK